MNKRVNRIFALLLVVCLILALTPLTALAATDITDDFTDANFLAAVRSALNKGAADPISDTDVENVTTLDVWNKSIESLDGIEHFTSLETLFCSGNLLTALPTLPATLEELYCVNNQLTGLDVTDLPLIYLDCSYNNMASESAVIGFTGTWGSGTDDFIFAPQLTTDITAGFTDANFLAAVRTALSKGASAPIYVSDVVGVTTLNVAGENIASLAGIEYFIGLEALVCYGNQLTELPELPTGLTRLDCYRNQLTALPELPSGLTSLDCSNNRLTALPTLPTGLITLNCYNNQLTTLPATLPNSLEYLNCSYNRLTSLDLTGLNNLIFSDGQNQERSLTMTGSGGSYTANVTMSAGATFGSVALSYANGVLTSTSNSATTSTFTAPTGLAGKDISGTLTLTYPGVGPTTYTVTVNSGTGDGKYAQGVTVSITASTAPSGQTFDKWTTTSSGVTFANANNTSTTFVMPAHAVTVTANYQNTGGGGGGGGGGGTSSKITSKTDTGGSIKGGSIGSNGKQTFTITPKDGYEIEDVLVDGKSVGAVSSYTFADAAKTTHTIEVKFKKTAEQQQQPAYQPMPPSHNPGTQVQATKTNNPLILDGETTQLPAVKISGNNWLKLRDFAMLLNGTAKQFSITYNEATGVVDIITGQSYTPQGNELADNLDELENALASQQQICVNGVFIDVAAYNVDGYNYFRLRDLAIILDFAVIYDEATGQITLDFSKPYSE